MRSSCGRAAALLIVLAAVRPAAAQTSFERFSLETTAAGDLFRGHNAPDQPQVVIDIVGTVRLGAGWQVYVRPWFRQPRNPDWTYWDAQIYQAAVRYERLGRVAARLDAGYIASPVGFGLFDTTPRINPTIAQHASYFTPMVPFDAGGPRVSAIAATYPLGAVATVSTDRWDARAALVNSAPTRIHVINGDSAPHPTPVVEAGGGVTPRTGLRFGVSFAHGEYLTAEELAPGAIPGDRTLTMFGVEGEYAIGYTSVRGELIRDAFTLPGTSASAYTWFVQGTRILSPQWFVAGRTEATVAPVVGSGTFFAAQPDLRATEATIGFRLTREITLRGSYYVRQLYGRTDWDNQAAISAVWFRRWR